jgi:hypothetical protein
MRIFQTSIQSVIIAVFACGVAQAGHFKADTTVDGMRIELHVLPAEPFFTKDQASTGNVKEGMVIMGGAKPLPLDAEKKPTHHLVIHVFDSLSAKAITNAKVKMSYQALDVKGNHAGGPIEVPVVVMQAVGKGKESTHYGNNVVMLDGPYVVDVSVNGKKLKFKLDHLFNSGPSTDYMPMH